MLYCFSITFTEIRILLRTLGGDDDTLFLACGFGDLCMTSLNDLSRNRTLGLLIGKGGLYGNVIRIAPSLGISKSEADELVTKLRASFQKLS